MIWRDLLRYWRIVLSITVSISPSRGTAGTEIPNILASLVRIHPIWTFIMRWVQQAEHIVSCLGGNCTTIRLVSGCHWHCHRCQLRRQGHFLPDLNDARTNGTDLSTMRWSRIRSSDPLNAVENVFCSSHWAKKMPTAKYAIQMGKNPRNMVSIKSLDFCKALLTVKICTISVTFPDSF
jgi:hypothetical protein